MLKEFARISSGTVIVSLWVDGNFPRLALARSTTRGKARIRGTDRPRDRFMVKRAEIESATFPPRAWNSIGHVDFLKYWDKWRTYVLRVRK
jgi:hypothetical protein